MKLQNLTIIFIIIIIPIILIFSYYLKLETKTIKTQTEYDEKLIEATKEAVEAFEINTTEWNSDYSTLANSKRRDIQSSINAFIQSLSNKLGISGTAKENILNYVPAIVYVMYDGYYIYSPTYVPQAITDADGHQFFYYEDATDSKYSTEATKNIKGEIVTGELMYVKEGTKSTKTTYTVDDLANSNSWTTNINNAKKTYKHVLKTFVPYTTTYGDYVINYTLDDYVRIYTKSGEIKEGYVIPKLSEYKPNSNSATYEYETTIYVETLSENIPVRDKIGDSIEVKSYTYVYNTGNDKRYYDTENGQFFSVDSNYVKQYLPAIDVNNSLTEYKKLLIASSSDASEYITLYQPLNKAKNGEQDNNWYIYNNGKYELYNISLEISKNGDCSAINYYVENYFFNTWLRQTFSIFEINEIMNKKIDNITENINENLNLSISNYTANSDMNYKLPEISDTDWEQALSGISMITFFQGVKIGLKTYNNYSIVTSSENNEYIGEDSLYYIDYQDEFYHRYRCSSTQSNIGLDGVYKNVEFKVQNFQKQDGTIQYYYQHGGIDSEGKKVSMLQCFDCIVNKNKMKEYTEEDSRKRSYFEEAYNQGLARERYIQMQRTRITDSKATTILPLSATIGQVQETTNGTSTTWNFTITITGGIAPYYVNSNGIPGNIYKVITSGTEKITYTIKDSAGNTTTVNFEQGKTDR